MNKHLRNHVASLFLLAPSAAMLAALPATALAQSVSPEVRSVEIRSDNGLEPGARLTLRVTGSPRARAVVRIDGVKDRIELREVSRGLYIGRYTLKRGERVAGDADVRATLRADNRAGAANYTLADVMESRPPVAVAPPAPPRIERFAMAPVDRIEPGSELRFTLDGFPGAAVVVDLPGVGNDLALREVRPGHYEGNYTIRRSDNLNLSRPIVATLRTGDRAVTATLAVPTPDVDHRSPNLVQMTPREGEVVPAAPNIEVSAKFDDRGGTGVDPATVRINLSGRNVTPDALISSSTVSYRATLAPGRHTVEVTARDRAGNAVHREWSFDVAAVAPANLPLQILSHANNAQVSGGSVAVQGRTAPFASVTVRVDAVTPAPGGFNVAQQVASQTVQADGQGNFSFSFSPRFPVPGARYEVAVVANKASANTEAKLVLHQR
jgi:hypothetical protein